VLGILLGLAITRLLMGLARFVQHPGRQKVYGVHVGWAAFLFVLLTHFWWWEFRLVHVHDWTFVVYAFLICYVVLIFLLCTLLFPDDLDEYTGYRDYFLSRRVWFFGLMALSFLLDLGDTLIKGKAYLHSLTAEYPVRNAAYIVLCLVAMRVRSERFHAAFVIAAIAYECLWIYRLYDRVS
jgi:hypothetical protein